MKQSSLRALTEELILRDEKLRASQALFSRVFAEIMFAISITELETGRIYDCNENFLALSRYTKEELLSSNTVDLHLWYKAEDRAYVAGELREGREVNKQEFQFRSKDGSFFIGLYSAKVILLDNHKYILSSIIDISDRKRTQEILQEAIFGSAKQGHILVVEDDQAHRQLAQLMFERMGHRVNSVDNGCSAIQYLRDHEVDLVFLDMVLGGIDGIETYQQILKLHPNQRAILVSGFLRPDIIERAHEAGITTTLTKPFSEEDLRKVVDNELAKATP